MAGLTELDEDGGVVSNIQMDVELGCCLGHRAGKFQVDHRRRPSAETQTNKELEHTESRLIIFGSELEATRAQS